MFFRNINIVTNKQIFKTKIYINKILEKLKAKLITKDFTQIFEINYKDIFASIVRFNILQVFFVIIILKNLKYY